eukprot:TRINITY_DN8069_c0_g1_i3.p1 TRINITY_DN8069_c0_g1~~TRINITY_DN8069_c0_g1_i3.p1  ORF type:complete len:294 (+),score=76.26 TRINITY_DN8069_c0_g1_i3:37-918(+)
MKWNENEILSHLATKHPDWEGQLSYKAPKSAGTFSSMHSQQYKERYLKLYGNILILSKGPKEEQTNLFVLENCKVQVEDKDIFSFSITFWTSADVGGGGTAWGGGEKHLFVAVNLRSMNQWLDALKKSSMETLKQTLMHLQFELRNRTGMDPLIGTNLEYNQNFSSTSLDLEKPLEEAEGKLGVQLGQEFGGGGGWGNGSSGGASSSPHLEKSCCDGQKMAPAASKFTSHLGIQVWEDDIGLRTCKGHCKEAASASKKLQQVGMTKTTFKSHLNQESDQKSNNSADSQDLIKF